LTFDKLNERRGIAEYNALVLEEAAAVGGEEGRGSRESSRDAYCHQYSVENGTYFDIADESI
jgi:hypothetical protein